MSVSADLFGDLHACLLETRPGVFAGGLVVDSLQKGDRKGGDGIALIVEYRKADIRHPTHLIAFPFFKSLLPDLGQVFFQVGRDNFSCIALPLENGPVSNFRPLMGEDHMPGSCLHEVHA